jgi:cellulose synthase/poly-beta-1,6-N-acetylglucosamine synthase-like glycosyltransferase
MDIIIYIIFSLFFIEHLILFIGLTKNLPVPSENRSSNKNFELPFISIIVAARNEEKVIEPCIKSLVDIDYPHDNFEIILVNDRSTDGTGSIMKKYSSTPYSNVKYLEIEETQSKLKGKTNALFNAIKTAKGEFIFTTDADIEVKPTWVKEMIKYYDDNIGVVSSYSVMKPEDLNSGIQSLDWIYLLTIAAGSFGLNQPISCVGNNMSYRRCAYDEVGGYEKIKFSVTEDFMLLQTIRKMTKWKSKFPLNNECMNWTLPCTSFMELYRQKKRWTKGGLDASWAGLLAGGLAWLVSAAFLFGWIFASLKIYILFLILKLIIDLVFTLPAVNAFKIPKVYLYIIPFEIYYALYVFFAPFIVLFDRKVVWKEQKL